MSLCNNILMCSNTDPTLGGCPISRASYKREVRYLGAQDLSRYRDELLQIRLAAWRYTHDPDRKRLGFLIDDADEDSVAVDASRDRVDLYGYTSLAVATVQAQAQEIEALKHRIAMIEARLAIEREKGTDLFLLSGKEKGTDLFLLSRAGAGHALRVPR